MRNRRLPGFIAIVLILSASLVASVNPVAWAGHDDMIDPDNAQHDIDNNNLTTNGSIASSHGALELEATNMTITAGNSDVHVYDDHYGSAVPYGLTTCTSTNWWNGLCDHYDVKFDLDSMSGLGSSKWRSLGCHEMGHTGGLSHRTASGDVDNNSCMREEIWPENLDAHDIAVINGNV